MVARSSEGANSSVSGLGKVSFAILLFVEGKFYRFYHGKSPLEEHVLFVRTTLSKHHQENRWMNPSCSAKDVLGNLSAQIRNFGAVRFFDVGGIIDYG